MTPFNILFSPVLSLSVHVIGMGMIRILPPSNFASVFQVFARAMDVFHD